MPAFEAILRLLATTDLHAHAFGWDYHADRHQAGLGLSDLAHLIDDARSECPNTLLLDNGDFLQGSPLGDWAAEQGADQPHPMISAMNALGYDAATLGNHEFSHGLPLLRRAIAEAQFPMISANIRSVDDVPLVNRSIVIERSMAAPDGAQRAIRIGITGIAPPQTIQWEAGSINGNLSAEDAVLAAAQEVRSLRMMGADVVILLAHTGIGPDGPDEGGTENVALPLAALSGADAMVLGHTHMVFPDPQESRQDSPPALLNGTPAVMPGYFGSHLGQIDMALRHDGRGWSLSGARAELLPARPKPEIHPGIETVCGPAHQAARSWLGTRIGQTPVPLSSYFARVAPTDLLRLVAAAQAHHLGERLAQTPFADLPLLAAAAPFRAGGRGGPDYFTEIDAGPLELRHANDIYPFPNNVVGLLVSGAELEDWLERAVIQFATLKPGDRDIPLINPDHPGFDFDLIDGLSFEIDLSHPPRFDALGRLVAPGARRIRDLSHGGRAIHPEDRFILATNSYRAAGSGGFPACRRDRVILDDKTPTRAALVRYLEAGPPFRPGIGFDWRLRPLGASALFETSTRAMTCLDHIATLHPEALPGPQPGVMRFRLKL
ncbi:MAG: bifunctional 2',3'-cyclic-nucleotide 2'-phosphodiesterase/3'-nucleotidase [Paracoccaceae bacterium]